MIIAVTILALVAVVLLLRGKQDKKPSGPDWRIGPIIDGKNYSQGMPARPTPQGDGWAFAFPTVPHQHVHYVQWFNPPSLVGKRSITIRFRVTGGAFVPQEFPAKPALVTLLIQRRGDDWSEAAGSHRWFSRESAPLTVGEFVLSVPLDAAKWKPLVGQGTPADFHAAIADLSNIGVLFGSEGGRGHGVYATGSSRFTLIGIDIA